MLRASVIISLRVYATLNVGDFSRHGRVLQSRDIRAIQSNAIASEFEYIDWSPLYIYIYIYIHYLGCGWNDLLLFLLSHVHIWPFCFFYTFQTYLIRPLHGWVQLLRDLSLWNAALLLNLDARNWPRFGSATFCTKMWPCYLSWKEVVPILLSLLQLLLSILEAYPINAWRSRSSFITIPVHLQDSSLLSNHFVDFLPSSSCFNDIINLHFSLINNSFPSSWKQSIIISIPKNHDLSSPISFYPISFPSFLSLLKLIALLWAVECFC